MLDTREREKIRRCRLDKEAKIIGGRGERAQIGKSAFHHTSEIRELQLPRPNDSQSFGSHECSLFFFSALLSPESALSLSLSPFDTRASSKTMINQIYSLRRGIRTPYASSQAHSCFPAAQADLEASRTSSISPSSDSSSRNEKERESGNAGRQVHLSEMRQRAEKIAVDLHYKIRSKRREEACESDVRRVSCGESGEKKRRRGAKTRSEGKKAGSVMGNTGS